jgi:hypothetical protein
MAFVMPRTTTTTAPTTTTTTSSTGSSWMDWARDQFGTPTTAVPIRNPNDPRLGQTAPTPAPEPPAPAPATLESILGGVNKQNWATDLLRVEDQLKALGYSLQKASDGSVRGRLYRPDGSPYDPFRDYGWYVPPSAPETNVVGGAGTGGFPSSGQTFTDPATQQWEQLLRQLVERMTTPQPTWTDAQMDLMQTQSLDPLERQRQAMKQQQTQRLAQRGIVPGSGVFDEAMAAIDRQFNQLRTQTQADFATQAIGREDQLFQNNEQRSLNAVNLFKQIPQYADTRLQLAANTLIPSNPAQLLSLQQQYQQQAMQNARYQQQMEQQFYGQLANVILSFFGGGR